MHPFFEGHCTDLFQSSSEKKESANTKAGGGSNIGTAKKEKTKSKSLNKVMKVAYRDT